MSDKDQVTLSALFELLSSIDRRVASFEQRLAGHMDEEEQEREKLLEELAALRVLIEAFPEADGKPDIHGHRRDHESRIAERRKSDQFWEQRKGKIVDMVLMAVAVLLLSGFINWVQQGGKIFG